MKRATNVRIKLSLQASSSELNLQENVHIRKQIIEILYTFISNSNFFLVCLKFICCCSLFLVPNSFWIDESYYRGNLRMICDGHGLLRLTRLNLFLSIVFVSPIFIFKILTPSLPSFLWCLIIWSDDATLKLYIRQDLIEVAGARYFSWRMREQFENWPKNFLSTIFTGIQCMLTCKKSVEIK